VISSTNRDHAAHWCALMASSDCELMEQIVNDAAQHAIDFADACGAELLNVDAAALSRAAFHEAADRQDRDPKLSRVIVPGGKSMALDMVNACRLDSRAAWAEAEAMIRTGWSPS
jgi:hypothetical protein